jgi:hypothetical protein
VPGQGEAEGEVPRDICYDAFKRAFLEAGHTHGDVDIGLYPKGGKGDNYYVKVGNQVVAVNGGVWYRASVNSTGNGIDVSSCAQGGSSPMDKVLFTMARNIRAAALSRSGSWTDATIEDDRDL